MSWSPTALAILAGCLLSPVPGPVDPEANAADEQLLKGVHLALDGPALLDFLRAQTLTETSRARVQALIRQLGDRAFAQREQASTELIALGRLALPQLRLAVRDDDLEVRRRAEDC